MREVSSILFQPISFDESGRFDLFLPMLVDLRNYAVMQARLGFPTSMSKFDLMTVTKKLRHF